MAKNRWYPLYSKLTAAAGLFFAAVVAIHILLPFLVNTAAMRVWILSRVAEQFDGELDFQAVKPALLPIPHAELFQVRLREADKFGIQFARAIIYPQYWPLLTGRLKISRLEIIKPEIALWVPVGATPNREGLQDRSLRYFLLKIGDTLVPAARDLGPMTLQIEEGRLVLALAGQDPVELTHIELEAEIDAKHLDLKIAGHSNLAEIFEVNCLIGLPKVDGGGRLIVSGLDTKRFAGFTSIPKPTPMPEAVLDLELNFQTQGLETIQSEFQVKAPQVIVKNGTGRLTLRQFVLKGSVHLNPMQVQIGLTKLQTASPGIELNGNVAWSRAGRPTMMPDYLMLAGVNLDVGEIRNAVLQLAGQELVLRGIFDIVQAGRMPELAISIQSSGVSPATIGERIGLQGRLTGGRIAVPHDLLQLDDVNGQVVLEKGRLTAKQVQARLGNSVARDGTLQLGLLDGTQAFSLDTRVEADLSELPAVLKRLTGEQTADSLLDRIPPVSGRAEGRLRLGDRLGHITAGITASGRIKVLDSDLDLSGTIDGLPTSGTSFQFDFSGPMGPRTVDWLGNLGGVPARWLPKAPFTVAGARLTRDPVGLLGMNAEFSFIQGMQMTAALKISRDELDVSKIHLKDTGSDAVIVLRRSRNGRNWKVGFNGRLDKAALDKLLRHNNMVLGWLEGDLQADFQTDALARSTIQGRLTSRQIDIPLGYLTPLSIREASLEGKGQGFGLSAADLTWQGSAAKLSGSGTFTSQALDLNLVLSADTLNADEIIQALKAQKSGPKPQPPQSNPDFQTQGSVRVQAGRLILGGYHFTTLQAKVDRQPRKTTVDVMAADLCGIATPGQIRFDQGGIWMTFKPNANGAALKDTDRCLASATLTERLEGTLEVSGTIGTQGRTGDELSRNLAGDLGIQVSDGRIFNAGAAGFFTNLLAFISVNQLIQGDLPDLRKNDFKFKNLDSKLTLKNGVMRIEEGVLKSNAVNIVGHGDYGLASKKLDLVLLVSPLTTVDWIVERIPLIGNILQGTLVAIPVGVQGPAADPSVVPLSPAAVGSRLGGILERTIKTPFRILSPFLKDAVPSKRGNEADDK